MSLERYDARPDHYLALTCSVEYNVTRNCVVAFVHLQGRNMLAVLHSWHYEHEAIVAGA